MASEYFVVTGAKRNSAEFSMDRLAYCYEAVICKIDFANKSIEQKYIENKLDENIYPKDYTLSFRGGCLDKESYYTCTHSEIVEFDLATLAIKNRITSPYFNDLHDIKWIHGSLWYASTGIDRVGKGVGSDAELYQVIPDDKSKSVDEGTDYRKISTKPHSSHPNHIFEIGDDIWVTRFEQKDAIQLQNPDARMDIQIERPHDGLLVDGYVYFTTVNGSIAVFDAKSHKCVEVHNLQEHYRQGKIGWCRGIEVSGQFAYVGFTRLRKTRSVKNLGFLTDSLVSLREAYVKSPPARIVKYDLKRRRIVDQMHFRNSELSVVFGINSIE